MTHGRTDSITHAKDHYRVAVPYNLFAESDDFDPNDLDEDEDPDDLADPVDPDPDDDDFSDEDFDDEDFDESFDEDEDSHFSSVSNSLFDPDPDEADSDPDEADG